MKFLASIFLLGFILNCSDLDAKNNINPNRFQKKKHKTSWAKTLANHPYYKRPKLTKEEWDKIPKSDRPDLAFEQDYMMTMDPALGHVPYERKILANQYVEEQLKKPKHKAAIAGVNWQERGPNNIGGRTRALMFDPNDASKKKVWAGGVGGGLWYTNDITVTNPTWVHVDGFWDNIAITSIAYNPNNTQEIYVGTGEGYGNGGAQRGGGIWKSSNGGTTWALLASTAPGAYNSSSHFQYVNKIVIKNDGTIFAATKGYYINTGGILRSTNGGTSWTRVLSVYTGSGSLYDFAGDIEIAANGDLYASFGIFSQGKVYKCTNVNNGASGTWTDISTNIGTLGSSTRIELACAPSDSNVLYAVARISNGDYDVDFLKKSFNGGTTWTSCAIPLMVDGTGNHFTRSQAWYDLILAVHPTNPLVVLAGGIDLHRTLDSGTAWTGISHWYGGFSKPYIHADQHAILFRPSFPNEVLFGNDGGLHYSTNAGNTGATPSFSSKNLGYNITQYYACAAKNEVNSHYFLAGAQDNGSHKFTNPQIGSVTSPTGGDGAFCHIDQDNPNIQLTSYTYNVIYRSTDGGSSFPTIVNEGTTGHFINPSDYDDTRNILYAASNNNILKRVSNMTATIKDTNLTISVGTAKVSTLKVSPYNDVVFLGIENGRIYKLSNASSNAPSLSRIDTFTSNAGWVSSIDVGANDNEILITFSNYGVKSVWETTNGGTTWRNKEGNLPDMPIRSIIYNPNNRNQVLVATEVGVWSTDNFATGTASAPVWGLSSTGLAYTRCDMLQYRPADKMVVIATHGRGLFTSDIFVTTRIADFSYDNTRSCTGSLTVNFTDGSLKPNNSWAWDVDGNGTIDYTTQNVTHTYSSAGLYSIKLKINGGTDSIQKNNIILVSNAGLTANTGCSISANSNSANGFGIGISNVTLNTINNTTSNNDGHYNDYSCSKYTVLIPNTLYTLSISTGIYNSEAVRAYIDYNNNNNLEASELLGTVTANLNGTNTISFTTPITSAVTMNTPLRLRVISRFSNTPTDACNVSTYGQAEDYTIYMKANAFALPVRLIDFVGNCNNNNTILNWTTASEDNNEVFIMERSRDAIHFEPIGEVPGAGTSKTQISYSFNDNKPIYGSSYYRLKQRDFDGRTESSKTITVKCIDKIELKLFPNPTADIISIQGFGKEAELRISNSLGVKLMNLKLKDNYANIDLGHLPNGIYNLSIFNEDELFTKQIVIRK
jgi:PKD repeat protein